MRFFMIRWIKLSLIVAALLPLSITASYAIEAREFNKAEDAVAMRQAHMVLIGSYFESMGAVIKGKKAYKPELFAEDAKKVKQLSLWSTDGFGSKLTTDKSNSKETIWENKKDFNELMNELYVSASRLSAEADKNSMDALPSPFKEVAASCKSCHKKYKSW